MPRYRFPIDGASYRPVPGRDRATRALMFRTRMESDFPHILAAIQAMWGYPELHLYFSKLMLTQRDKRDGFPQEVWDDIHLLWQIHQAIVPDPLSSLGAPCL